MTNMNSRTKFSNSLLIFLSIIILVAFISIFLQSRLNILPQLIESAKAPTERLEFPKVDGTNLSVDQQKIVSILKTEYALNPPGTKYSQGVSEPWCADFVSWVFYETDSPLVNPNSKSWRIPGTFTLREYYESTNKLMLATEEYTPKVGDIMLYDNPSSFGQHANFVIHYNDGLVTTIGGNEPGGIRMMSHQPKQDPGFIGYGVL